MNSISYFFNKALAPRGYFPPCPGLDSPAGQGKLTTKYRAQRIKWKRARKLTVAFKFGRTRRKLARQARLLAAEKRQQAAETNPPTFAGEAA